MLAALDTRVGSQHGSKYIQLGAAEALANGRRGADRAVVLDQQEAAVGLLAPRRHVALARAQLGETRDPVAQIAGAREGAAVTVALAFLAARDQAVEPVVAEQRADRADEVGREVGMASGAALAGVANGLGAGQALPIATAEAVAFWVQAGFIPVMIVGVFLAFRLAARPMRQTDD